MAVNYKTRVARTLFIILLTFILCRLPFTVLVFWRNEKIKQAQLDSVSIYQMFFSNSIVNMIYNFIGELLIIDRKQLSIAMVYCTLLNVFKLRYKSYHLRSDK